jgi:hypothetical protein
MDPRDVMLKCERTLRADGVLGDSRENTFAENLLGLQWIQLNHDERYHKDIVRLPVADRLKHFALHMAKYVGYFAEAIDSEDSTLLERTLVDAFIISLASANTLNLDLGHALSRYATSEVDSLRTLRFKLAHEFFPEGADGVRFLKELARRTSRFAKACESLDHVESHPFREAMSSSVLDIFQLLLAESSVAGIDPVERAKARIQDIEPRNIFHRFYL